MSYDEDEDAKKTVFIRTAIEGHTACKKANDYGHLLCSAIYDLQKSYTDYEIRLANGSSIPCHKIILAISSPFFKIAFNSGLADSCEKEMDLSHLDVDIVKDIVQFFYSGELLINSESIVQLVEAASYLALDDLLNECERHISLDLKDDVIGYWFGICRLFGLKKITQQCTRYWFKALCKTEDFKKLNFQDFMDIIKDVEIEVDSEDEVLQACIDWIIYEEDKRKQYLVAIIDQIHLKYCSSAYMDFVAEQYSDIMPTSFKCKQLRSTLIANQTWLSPRLNQSIEKMLLIHADSGPFLLDPSGKWKLSKEAIWYNNFDLRYGSSQNVYGFCSISNGFISYLKNSGIKFHNTCRKVVQKFDIDDYHDPVKAYFVGCEGNVFFWIKRLFSPIHLFKLNLQTGKIISYGDGPDIDYEDMCLGAAFSAIAINAKIYILELYDHSKIQYFYCYNIEDNSWKLLKSLKERWNGTFDFAAYSYGRQIIFVPRTCLARCFVYDIEQNIWKLVEPPNNVKTIVENSVYLSHLKLHDEIVFIACMTGSEILSLRIDRKFSLSLKTLKWSKSTMSVPKSMRWVCASLWVEVAFAYRLESAEDDASTFEEVDGDDTDSYESAPSVEDIESSEDGSDSFDNESDFSYDGDDEHND